MSTDWREVLLAYLHDPPDKALSVRGHKPRARDNAKLVLGDHVSRKVLEDSVSIADPLASIVERFPMPMAGDQGERAVGPQNSQLQVFHPLSAGPKTLHVPQLETALSTKQQDALRAAIAGLAGDGEAHTRNRFLAVWRLWPDGLRANVHETFALLPADTRTPDHTIWNHLDVTAAFKAAESGASGAALLAFAVAPVQPFIEAARSVRDLWSGSMILSWLAFRAMLPLIEQLGPTALLAPALRGNPLVDLWLRDAQRLGSRVPLPKVELRMTPSLPHRFLALVPCGAEGAAARGLAERCRQAAVSAVKDLAEAVKKTIQETLDGFHPGWNKRWDHQVTSYFSFSAAVVPLAGSADESDERLASLLAGRDSFKEAFRDAEAVRELARSVPPADRPGYPQDHAGYWQYQVELVGRVLAAHRALRHVPTTRASTHPNERYPQKCTLLGSFEQMGPDELSKSENFWDRVADPRNGLKVQGVRVRRGESLCAVAVVKRFATPAFLRHQLELSAGDLRFPDTWTVAAAEWLHRAGVDWKTAGAGQVPWNGHWLHWSKPDQDPEDADACPAELWEEIGAARRQENSGAPPVYYAILKLDGDDVGGWLRGENSPAVREVMHPKLVQYYEGLGPATKAGLDAKRPVGPALHAAISTGLAHFALRAVPEVVRRHHGTVIYSGGDDTLLLLPARQALSCALALRDAYTGEYYALGGREYVMMGNRATLSGGVVVVHAKDDLRLALQDARRAEREAKEAGRDALMITIRRRSGEHTAALCPWALVEMVRGWTAAFERGASDRWAYRLYSERETLAGLPVEAIKAEMRRQLKRAEEPTPRLIPPDGLVAAFDQFRQSSIADGGGGTPRFGSVGIALDHFLTLCHTASFLARGRDA